MLHLPTVSRRIYIVSGTVTILFALFGYYFWMYLPKQEENLIAQRVRAIYQVQQNFIEKHAVTVKNLAYNSDELTTDGYKEISENERNLNEFNFAVTENEDTVWYSYSFEKFFRSLKRPESFSNYLVYYNNNLVYNHVASHSILVPTNKAGENTISDLHFVRLKRNTFRQHMLATNPNLTTGLDVKMASIDYKLFTTSFKTIDNSQWTIYGFVKADTLASEMKEMPVIIVVSLSFGVLLVLFALPLFKLFFMSPLERLHIKDLVFSVISFVVCPAIILILIFALEAFFIREKNYTDTNLKNLSQKIETDLKAEIRKLYEVINDIEKDAISKTLKVRKETYSRGRIANKVAIIKDNTIRPPYNNQISTYPYLNKVYWIDSKGKDRYEYTAELESKNGRLRSLDLSERNYFKEIANGKGWTDSRFSLSNSYSRTFYIEPIYSWLTGKNTAILSKNSSVDTIKVKDADINYKDIKVVAAQAKLHSVSDLILPAGYSYCIVDIDGKVLFHNEERKNLQENYLEECNYAQGLQSAFASETETYIGVQYFNKENRVYVNPIDDIPWFLITSHNAEYTYVPYQHIVSLTIICVFLISAFALLQIGVVSLFQMKKSKLKHQIFYNRWLWPYRENSGKFKKIGIANVSIAILLYMYSLWIEDNFLMMISAFIYAALFSFAIAFVILHNEHDKNLKLIATSITISLSLIILLVVYKLHSNDISILELFAPPFICVVILFFAFIKLKSTKEGSLVDSVATKYSWMICSYLLVTSILPSLLLFDKISKQEALIWKRFELFTIAKKLENRNWEIKEKHQHKPEKIYKDLEEKGRVYLALGYTSCECPEDGLNKLDETEFHKLLARTRPYYHNLSSITANFVYAQDKRLDKNQNQSYQDNFRWITEECSIHGLRMKYTPYRYPNEDKPIVVAAKILPFLELNLNEFKIGHVWIIILVLLLLVLIYRIVIYTSKRMFGIDIISHTDIIKTDDLYVRESQNNKDPKQLFVIAPPFAGTHFLYSNDDQSQSIISSFSKFFIKRWNNKTDDQSVLSGRNPKPIDTAQVTQESTEKIIEEIQHSRNKCIVLKNFSYNISDLAICKLKLSIVESLVNKEKTLVVIFSKLSPTQIYDEYERHINISINEATKHELKIQVARWRDILSGFIQIYYSSSVSEQKRSRLKEDSSIDNCIKYEVEVNKHYFERFTGLLIKEGLNEMTDDLKEILESAKKTNSEQAFKEELLLKIQNMAQPYYFSLWNSCSREEKYLLYDLAVDGLVNTKNLHSIYYLMEKGLIFYDESFHVMNESFRNFILSDNCKEEALDMEKELRKTGNWNLARTVILISLISVIGFVLFAHESIVDQFIALLAGASATLPYLFRFGNLFNSNSLSATQN